MGAFAQDWTAMTAMSRQHRQPDPRPAELAGLAKRVWLLLYSEGGHWTAEEIRSKLQIDRPIIAPLGEMVRNHYLVRHRGNNIDGELSVKFAVSRKCRFPRGVTVEEVQELLQLVAHRRPS